MSMSKNNRHLLYAQREMILCIVHQVRPVLTSREPNIKCHDQSRHSRPDIHESKWLSDTAVWA